MRKMRRSQLCPKKLLENPELEICSQEQPKLPPGPEGTITTRYNEARGAGQFVRPGGPFSEGTTPQHSGTEPRPSQRECLFLRPRHQLLSQDDGDNVSTVTDRLSKQPEGQAARGVLEVWNLLGPRVPDPSLLTSLFLSEGKGMAVRITKRNKNACATSLSMMSLTQASRSPRPA